MGKFYKPIEITYDSWYESVNESYMLEVFRALLSVEGDEKFGPKFLIGHRFRGCKFENKADAYSEARSRNLAEQLDRKLSRGPGRFKAKWLVKEVDEDGLPVLNKAKIKKIVKFVNDKYPGFIQYIKEEYKQHLN